MSYQDYSEMLRGHFTECLKEALRALGEGPARSFYYLIQRKYSMDVGDLPDRVRDFDRALVDLFGPGARVIVRTCAEKLSGRMRGITPRERTLSRLWLEVMEIHNQGAGLARRGLS